MKRLLIKICLFNLLLIFCVDVFAQNTYLDTLRKQLAQAKDDNTRFRVLSHLATMYIYVKPDSAMLLAQQTIALAKKINNDTVLSQAWMTYAANLSQAGNYPQAIYFELEALKLAEKTNDPPVIGWNYESLAGTYVEAEDYEHALFYGRKAKALYESHRNFSAGARKQYWNDMYSDALQNLAIIYTKLNQPDTALMYVQRVKNYGDPSSIYGDIYFIKEDYAKALGYYREDCPSMAGYNGLAKTFRKLNQIDLSIYYANKAVERNPKEKYPLGLLEALGLLADIYKLKGDNDSAVKYLQLTLSIKDSLFNQRKIMQMQSLTFNEQLRQQDIVDAQKAYRNKIKTYILIGGLIVLLFLAFILFRSNRQKQKAKTKIQQAYTELKNAQQQLIQSEKMASLGELTAGIAHEIQNPLNFVNNFSEVNKELLAEMKDEMNKGNIDDANAIANDVIENEEKINHHGKRADAIVKGMLQHSKQTKGVKEPTDINALCDEYLRLSYHGMRAKDKNFNAEIKTDFDETIGKINIVPQDIGRVLLNLFNNAFYAVSEKQKTADENYKPLITVATKSPSLLERGWGEVKIRVSDNGNGIPQNIIDKIFQPFFTTKPTGEGTGLGLSLSYDIIKAHGGEIKVETREGEGTTFSILLPNHLY